VWIKDESLGGRSEPELSANQNTWHASAVATNISEPAQDFRRL